MTGNCGEPLVENATGDGASESPARTANRDRPHRSYRALVFDLDRTIVEHDQDPATLLQGACEAVHVDPFCDPETLERAGEVVAGRSETLDTETFERRIFETAAAACGVDVDAGALASAYRDALDPAAVSLRPGAEAALAAASEYDTALVTNGPERTHATKLAAVGLEAYFDAVVFGSDVPRAKPAGEPFDRALDRLGVEADGALKVGDSLRTDVAGAANRGIDSAWVPYGTPTRCPGDPEPTYVLSTLAELPELLDGQ
jgi:HAD superfamily hydrolase (TIGR01509 family)